MRTYCKAYLLRDMRQFSDWNESQATSETSLTDDSIVYLWDDFSVASSPIHHDTLIFTSSSSAWEDFCTHSLHFAIPEDLQQVYADQPAPGATVSAQ